MELLTIMRHALNVSHEAHWEEAFYTVQSHFSQSIDTTLSQTAFAAQLDPEPRDPKGVEPMDSTKTDGGVEPPLSPSLLDPPPRLQNEGLNSEAEARPTAPLPEEGASVAQQCSSPIQDVSSTSLEPSDLRSPSPRSRGRRTNFSCSGTCLLVLKPLRWLQGEPATPET